MPLYSFHCVKCKHTQDELLFEAMGVSERVQYADKSFTCEECGSSNWSSRINVPQLDSSSNTFRESVNGYYSKALGRHISSRKEEQKIMESRGFVCEADLPKHTWEEAEEKAMRSHIAQEEYVTTYQNKLAAGKTKEEAVAETFTAQDALSGKLDATFGVPNE